MADAPPLENEYLRLVPFGAQHMTLDYVGWLNDPDVVRYSENRHRRHSFESCQAYVADLAAGPSQLWAIEAMDQDGQHIGNITASHDPNNRLADIGILIGARGCQGRGYGRLAWGAVLTYLETRPDLHKITGGCLAANQAMVRIMQRAGMEPDGIRTAHYMVDGQPTDLVYYYRFGQWEPLSNRL